MDTTPCGRRTLLNTSWFRIDKLDSVLRPILLCKTTLDTELTVSDVRPMRFTTNTVQSDVGTRDLRLRPRKIPDITVVLSVTDSQIGMLPDTGISWLT